jgi:hypothetical protein
VTQSASGDQPTSDRVQVDGDADRRVLGDDTTVVGGAATLEADEIVLRATQRIVLEVGSVRVLLDGAGIAVEASGGTVSVTGAEEVVTDAFRVRMRSATDLDIAGTTVRIDGSADVEVTGGRQFRATAGMIRLN